MTPERPPIEFSYTHSKDAECGYRFKRLVLDGEEEADFEESTKGTRLHMGAGLYGIYLAQRKRKSDKTYFDRLLEELTEDIHPLMAADILDVGGAFREGFDQDPSADMYMFETRLAVSYPDFEPCSASELRDMVAGTPDRVVLNDNFTSARVDDWKFGHLEVEYDEVWQNLQLKTYCWLTWLNFRDQGLTRIMGNLWGVRWGINNQAQAEWGPHNIEALDEEMRAFYSDKFDEAEERWLQHGPADWPAKGGPCCNWCRFPGNGCPKYAKYLQSYRSKGVEDAPET